MLLSIVTGTYQRLPSLQRMVASVRNTVPDTLSYEFVIVDGGSTDGTIEWCKSQPDIVVIEQGALLGAVKAFNAGAMAARGEYVLLANDDVEVMPSSILRAIVHLEDSPTCGAVAFADNRHADYKEMVASGYGVQKIFSVPGMIPYAQVGLFRKWLGDLVGWWGLDDPLFRDAMTYGGDALISARIWELGYTIDAVRGVTVHDHIQRDDLRQRNTDIEDAYYKQHNIVPYYRRYPNGPKLPDRQLIPPRGDSQLRTLYLPIYEPGSHYAVQKAQKRGLRDAFARRGLVWEIDYIAEHARGKLDLVGAVDAWKPDILFLQLHSTDEIQAGVLAEARKRNPSMLVIEWVGDVYSRHLLAPGMIELLRHVDLHLCVNASVFPNYAALGITADYWQCGWEDTDEEHLPEANAHDVVFTGNCYSELRRDFGQFLYSLSNVDVGIYGSGWPRASGQSTYNFALSRAIYKNAKLVVGDNQWPNDTGFVSNRVFDTLVAGGGLLLHQRIPGVEEYTGIKPGVHYIEWENTDDLRERIAYWLNPKQNKERQKIVKAARNFMLEKHSFDARLDELFDVLIPKHFSESQEYINELA